MTFENPEACPAETTIQVFHMEEGEYILEFESEHDEDFNMAVLKMLGGHAHHDHHGHGSGPFEWAGIFSINDATHTWTMEKVDGSYADPSMRVVLIPTDTPTEETMHTLEDGVEDLIEGDSCTVIEDGESMTPVDGGSCFEWHVGTGDISTFTIDTTGITGLVAYTAHSPYEFEATQHYFKDSAGNDVEHVAEEGGGGHGHHDDHDDHGDEHGDDDEMCHNTETHENYDSTEEECEAAGHMWTGEEHHDDDHGGEMCHNTETHQNYEATEDECEAAGHVWLGHEDHDLPEIHADRVAHTLSFPEDHSDEDHHSIGAVVIHIEAEGDYGFALPNDIEFFIVMGEGGHDDHDDHDGHGDDDHDDHGDDDHDDEIVADDGEDAFTYDPHSWLSPMAFRAQVNLVLDAMSSTFPNGSSSFNTNANNYSNQLMDLHISYVAAFGDEGTCAMAGQDKTIVANHNAYSYMSVAYDIEIMTLHGLDPEGEPSPADIAEVVEHINEEGITVLFVEEYTDQTAVNSIVSETGVSIEILYTMEMAPSDSSDDYLSMMNKNLQNIISGCGC